MILGNKVTLAVQDLKMHRLIYLCAVMFLVACGKAEFAGSTAPSTATDIPVLTSNNDFFAEIGQEFSAAVAGDIVITNVMLLGKSKWPGTSAIQFEVRIALTGTAAPNAVSITGGQKPIGWDVGTLVFNQSIPAGGTLTSLQSANLKDVMAAAVVQGKFWIGIRVRYAGFDIPKNLTVQEFQAFAEGEKSLTALSPLINLTF